MNASIRPSGGAVTQFPMMPEKITLGADAKFMTYSIISLGDVKIPRGPGNQGNIMVWNLPRESEKKLSVCIIVGRSQYTD